MAQELKDMPISMVPVTIAGKISGCAHEGLTDQDGTVLSSYAYLQKVAKDPVKYAPELRTLGAMFVNAGIAFGGLTVTGIGILLAPFAAMASFFMTPFLGGNRVATLVILNDTTFTIKKSGLYQAHGVQTGRPVFKKTEFDVGKLKDGDADLIPGMIEPAPGLELFGLSMYRFEKDLDLGFGVRGTMGAISLKSEDPKRPHDMAVAWMVGQDDTVLCAVTINLGKYGSLKDFYNKTVGAGKAIHIDIDGRHRIKGQIVPRTYDEKAYEKQAADAGEDVKTWFKNSNEIEDQVLTVAIQ